MHHYPVAHLCHVGNNRSGGRDGSLGRVKRDLLDFIPISIKFWYCQKLRRSFVGSRCCRRSKSSRRVAVVLWYHTRPWRGRPVRCETRSRGVTRSVASASYNLKLGMYALTGVSQS